MSWTKITALDTPFKTGGREYRVEIEGDERADGTWGGRIAFVSGSKVRRTGQETSQPSRESLKYWATGLEAVYLEGALARARDQK